ncbi:hypothetical protein ACFSHT_11400 [Paraburkholderia silviterrae]|uniref:Uncharacterized protein n=1 Tax=Paraburkholderia silviterrae TaxID=2528715 RepID=A0A4R5MFJ3_9BURK|nr:hypothetical protein [Paraburkholderia silviterrae]TDG25543.1 hypothetical protein EYW47_06885 [Paraburkholderia silviterrae]
MVVGSRLEDAPIRARDGSSGHSSDGISFIDMNIDYIDFTYVLRCSNVSAFLLTITGAAA